MRSTRKNVHRSAATSRALLAGVPAAVAGSIALTLSAVPAHAATTDAAAQSADHVLRGIRSAAPAVATVSVPRALAGPAAEIAAATAGGAASAVARVTAEAAPATYTVQRGDTVSRIAARFGLRTGDVLALNGLGWSSTI
ncbi:MAG TPA: LysM domain-containing protein, partial [Microbacterium sp.]|uniref:LysM peptidoglycan-binding domain-containing protein n=1 Tax=Microbacterium sp. TaxID=51671 RepID=UPI002F9233CA